MVTNLQQQNPRGFTADDEIDEMFGYANPNRKRVGCPPADILSALAKRELPIGHPWYEHLVHCSPCYRAVRAFQQARHVRTP